MWNESMLLTDFAAWSVQPESCRHAPSIELARSALLDTLGCMIAGRREPQIRMVADAMIAAGNADEALSSTDTPRYSKPATALINGSAIHILDFDDYEVPASTHPSAPILGALSAFTDRSDFTLGQLLEAFIAGYEIVVRMGQALGGYDHYMAGWHATSTVGPFGAAASTARFLGLDAQQTTNALAIATSMSAGLKAQFGTDTKALQAGLAARAGVEATVLAKAGLSASSTVLGGAYGYLARYGGSQPLASHCMKGQMQALSAYPILRKPWPSCAYSHRSIEAALAISADPDFSPSQVRAGSIRIAEPYSRVVPFKSPKSTAEARFSLTWCVAVALVDGVVSTDSFSDSALERTNVQEMMSRLTVDVYTPPPSLSDMSPDAPDTVTLTMANGTKISHCVKHVKGGAENPLTKSEVREKFLMCGGTIETAQQVLDGSLNQPFQFFA